MAKLNINAVVTDIPMGNYQVDVVVYAGGSEILHSRTDVVVPGVPTPPPSIGTVVTPA